LAAPNSSLFLLCNHQVMCAECATTVLSSSSQPQCPMCRSMVTDCIYF
jgi:rubrerythrin